MQPDYSRQTLLKEIGAQGQAVLALGRVLIVGAGGLGSPVLQYLAGAGVGCLGIVDADTLDASNLHRQPLFALANVGERKVELAPAGGLCQRLSVRRPAAGLQTGAAPRLPALSLARCRRGRRGGQLRRSGGLGSGSRNLGNAAGAAGDQDSAGTGGPARWRTPVAGF